MTTGNAVLGLPGVRSDRNATYRRVRKSDRAVRYIEGGGVISGAAARDPLNTGYLHTLEPGMLMGVITASGKWAPSIIGLTTVDYTSGGTSLTVSAATAVEIVRRLGASGTAKITTAPTAGGTINPLATLTYSAVDQNTGVITITNFGANIVAGAMIGPLDGSATPLGIVDDGTGIKVTDDTEASIDVPFPNILVGGMLDSSQILNWPAAANTSYIAQLKAWLNNASNNNFTFDDVFGL